MWESISGILPRESATTRLLEAIDRRVDEQTDGRGIRDGVRARGEQEGVVVVLLVVPVTSDEVQRLCAHRKELKGLEVESLAPRPLVPHPLQQSRHPHQRLVALLEPAPHVVTKAVVLVGVHEVVETVVGLRVRGRRGRCLGEIEGSSRVGGILAEIVEQELCVEFPARPLLRRITTRHGTTEGKQVGQIMEDENVLLGCVTDCRHLGVWGA